MINSPVATYYIIVPQIPITHSPGPRNWHPLARTAAHRLAESCWWFWCWRMSSVTVLSPRERAALTALARPSSSTSWQLMRVTNFLCIGRDRSEVEPLVPEPVKYAAILLWCYVIISVTFLKLFPALSRDGKWWKPQVLADYFESSQVSLSIMSLLLALIMALAESLDINMKKWPPCNFWVLKQNRIKTMSKENITWVIHINFLKIMI